MRLEQLNHILEVASQRSISRAAERLHISQPALSASIKALETELGKVLFKRTNKGISLTADGEQICGEATVIRNMVDGWHASGPKGEPEGDVHVASLPIISSFVSRNLLLPFSEKYPKITVFIHNVRHFDIVQRLKDTHASIAMTTLPLHSKVLEQVRSLDWEAKKLASDERMLCIGASHPILKKGELSRDDLKSLDLAWYSDTKDEVSKGYTGYFASSYRLANKEDCLDLVIRNKAVFIQPWNLFRNDWRVTGNLIVSRAIPLANMSSNTDVYAFHAPALSDAEQVFWEYLNEQFGRYL